jgi:hypothetical protein
MNSQLYAHLEAYDVDDNNGDNDNDDDDDSSSSSRSQLIGNETKKSSTTVDVTTTNLQKRTKDTTFIEQAITVVPIIGVALSYYYYYYCNEESFISINNWYHPITIPLFLTIFLVCWNKNPKFLMRLQQKSSIMSQQKQLSPPSLLPSLLKRSNDDAVINHEEKTIEKAYDCRREISRLLGLIGSPPMSLMMNNANANNSDSISINITDVATMSVIEFLEAHVQFILSIDEALYWMKISSSLHWGLGPHSQCVERVERAAIATNRRRRRSRDSKNNNDKNQLEPQRKLDTSSILALSSTRQNIAKVIVNESQSILEAITAIHYYIQQQQQRRQGKQQNKENVKTTNNDDNEYNHRTNKDGDDQHHNDNGGDIVEYIVNNGLLVIPDVIDLIWIKSSRKHLANMLGNCVDYLSNIDCLEVLSVEQPLSESPRSKLNESMWNARNLKEYIRGNLLLDNSSNKSSSPSISPIGGTSSSSSSSSTDHKFMMSLLQYRQQLDALNAVLLSCQQYTHHQSSSSCSGGGAATINDDNSSSNHYYQEQEQDNITNSVKISWWNQVKELSATCQTLEKDIENRFIPLNEHSQNTDSVKDGREVAPDSCQSLAKNHALNESQNYEHTEKDEIRSLPKHEQDQDRPTTTKTFVFSGKGVREIRLDKTKQKMVIDSEQRKDQVDTPPPRDMITEQLLVRELQSRIRTVARLRDEDHVIVASRVDEYQESEDDEDLQEHHTDEGNFKDTSSNGFCENRPTVIGDDVTVGTKREVTTNIFLGASGSLLAELKNNLPSNEFQIDEGFSLI